MIGRSGFKKPAPALEDTTMKVPLRLPALAAVFRLFHLGRPDWSGVSLLTIAPAETGIVSGLTTIRFSFRRALERGARGKGGLAGE
jgi:hypothetical protein